MDPAGFKPTNVEGLSDENINGVIQSRNYELPQVAVDGAMVSPDLTAVIVVHDAVREVAIFDYFLFDEDNHSLNEQAPRGYFAYIRKAYGGSWRLFPIGLTPRWAELSSVQALAAVAQLSGLVTEYEYQRIKALPDDRRIAFEQFYQRALEQLDSLIAATAPERAARHAAALERLRNDPAEAARVEALVAELDRDFVAKDGLIEPQRDPWSSAPEAETDE